MQALPTSEIATASTDDERLAVQWVRAFDTWINSFKAPSTVRGYRDVWHAFLKFAQQPPWKIGRSLVADYVADLRGRGLSDATVQLHLSALSSFYEFVGRDYTVINASGREVPLHDINPANSHKLRKRVKPYARSNYLNREEIRQFFSMIDRGTVQGIRDYALFLAYILTGRRNSEIRALKWGHIDSEEGCYRYRWFGKNNPEGRLAELPKPVYEAIVAYLKAAGRLETIGKDDFVFVATNENADRLPAVQATTAILASDPGECLSMRMVGKLLKKYSKLAGIKKALSCHSLRHSATMLRRRTGESIEDLSKFLGHAKFMTTFVYIHAIEGYRDPTWSKVDAMLGLDPAK